MIDTIRTEFLKVRTTRTAGGLLVGLLLLAGLALWAMIANAPPAELATGLASTQVLVAVLVAIPAIVLVLGIRSFTDEVRHGWIVPRSGDARSATRPRGEGHRDRGDLLGLRVGRHGVRGRGRDRVPLHAGDPLRGRVGCDRFYDRKGARHHRSLVDDRCRCRRGHPAPGRGDRRSLRLAVDRRVARLLDRARPGAMAAGSGGRHRARDRSADIGDPRCCRLRGMGRPSP